MNNPFEPSFGNRPERIVGRDTELESIERGLCARRGSRDRTTFVNGLHGMGKTALLLEIETRAVEHGYVVARAIASETMASTLIERLQLRGGAFVKDDRRRIAGFSAGAMGFSLGLTFTEEVQANYGFETKLGLICDRLEEEGRGVLLLVDEVLSTSKEVRQLASAYQNLVGDGKNIAVCMAGLPAAISDVLNDKVLTFLNRATKVHLGPLQTSAIREYYARSFAAVGRTANADVIQLAATATGGFPYLMQLIGYYLIEESSATGIIDASVLQRSLAYAQDDLCNSVFRPTLDALSEKDVDFLAALADSGNRASGASIQRRMGVTNGYFQTYRKRLLDTGVVQAPCRGELELAIPYLGEYLRSGGR